MVDEGSRVAEGQVLAYLNTERLLARKNELISALNQRKANVKLAKITYRRYKTIVHDSAVSKQQLDEAKEDLMATQAALELARSRIKSIEIEIEKSTLMHLLMRISRIEMWMKVRLYQQDLQY